LEILFFLVPIWITPLRTIISPKVNVLSSPASIINPFPSLVTTTSSVSSYFLPSKPMASK